MSVTRREYTHNEDKVIVEYIMKNNAFRYVNGNKFWQIMEEKKVLPGRTYQSIRSRYLKNIEKRLKTDFRSVILQKKWKMKPHPEDPPIARELMNMVHRLKRASSGEEEDESENEQETPPNIIPATPKRTPLNIALKSPQVRSLAKRWELPNYRTDKWTDPKKRPIKRKQLCSNLVAMSPGTVVDSDDEENPGPDSHRKRIDRNGQVDEAQKNANNSQGGEEEEEEANSPSLLSCQVRLERMTPTSIEAAIAPSRSSQETEIPGTPRLTQVARFPTSQLIASVEVERTQPEANSQSQLVAAITCSPLPSQAIPQTNVNLDPLVQQMRVASRRINKELASTTNIVIKRRKLNTRSIKNGNKKLELLVKQKQELKEKLGNLEEENLLLKKKNQALEDALNGKLGLP